MQLPSDTVRNDEESDKDLSLIVPETVENATFHDVIEALEDDQNVCISTEKTDLIQAGDHKGSMILTLNTALLRSNDEEVNQDLSFEVLEKAENATKIDASIEAAEVLKDYKTVSTQIDGVIEPAEVPKDDNKLSIFTGLKDETETSDWTEFGDDDYVITDEEIKETVGCESLADKMSIEDEIEISDNIVMRKLLRWPRYFDLLDSGRGACYNCGEEGHTVVRCTMAKRRKPCFVCGSLEHNAKKCAKGHDCFICKKGGHRAKNCPEKNIAGLHLCARCLKCGQSGHGMFSCQSSYSSDDLKKIQCYICKEFGHLCCAKYTFTVGGKVSCYRCGQSGHTGLACNILRGERNEIESPNSCYKCGGGGHFALECTNSLKPYARLLRGPNKMESPSTCYKCGQGGHFARECTESIKAATRLRGGPNIQESPSSCYRCGGEGHFARECSNSPMAYTRLHEYQNGSGSPSSCYKCGEEGHFARECTTSAKSSKRNREFSFPKYKHSKRQQDSFGRKSWPGDLGKPCKRKRTRYEREFSTPVKSTTRRGWTTEHLGDLPRRKARNKGWNSPATPTSRHKKHQKSNGGDYSLDSRSTRKFQKFKFNNSN
ncbi:uncharacterized protein LOC108224625 isoform X2 [Daucus carota subsp. sativus]|uniref:uncharacterized protein LOC108224625 isoform X2 n=1 Tax=Daucus carota subsp. sativus TaxID=79200 RepID=UPI0030834023